MPPKPKTSSGKPVLDKRVPTSGRSVGSVLSSWNRWRASYNPLRGITMPQVVNWLEAGERGEYADIQWLYRFIEKRDPTLRALVARRRSALLKLDWDIKIVAELPEGSSEAQAEAQKKTLRAAYDFVDNLREAIQFLALAEFRGFAHLQKHMVDGSVRHLEWLPQWNWVREMPFGAWFWNPQASATGFQNFVGQPENQINPADFIIRQVESPVDEIAAICFLRKNLSQKDWDSFIEIYGIPGTVITGPPNVPQEKEADYQAAAEAVAEGGSGYLPNGSTVSFANDPRGINPFRDHIKYQDEQLVLAGTSGKLTMLAESGSGTLAGGAHEDTFNEIAVAEAQEISELFQDQFDAPLLAEHHPDEPPLAYFELCAKDDVDITELADQAVKFGQAGFNLDPEELTEKTGLTLTTKPPPEPFAGRPGQPGQDPEDPQDAQIFANRAGSAATVQRLAQAFADDLQPIRDRLERILLIQDETILRSKLVAFQDELPRLLEDINADPESARALETMLTGAVLTGAKEAGKPK